MREAQDQNVGGGGGKCCLTCGCIVVFVIIGLIVATIYGAKKLVDSLTPYLTDNPRTFTYEVLSADEVKSLMREWNTFSDGFGKRKVAITLNEKQLNSIISTDAGLKDNLSFKIGENSIVTSFKFKFPTTEKFADCDITFIPTDETHFDSDLECFGDKPLGEDFRKDFKTRFQVELEKNMTAKIDKFKIENGEITIEASPRQ